MRKKYNKSRSIYALIIFVYAVFQTTLSFAGSGESMFKALQLPDTQSCSINRDLLSDEATYSKKDITGALPYIRSYETTLSNNQNRVNDMTAGLKSIGGWTDNYNNYALVEDADNGRDTRIRVRLPGDKDDTYYIYAAGANTIQRIFSPTPMIFEAVYLKYSNGNYSGADPIGYISQDHRDRPLTITAGGSDPTKLGFYVKTKGVIYQFKYLGYQIGTNQKTKVYKAVRIIYPNRTQLGLSYENYGGKGLLSVADNRGHILTFNRSLKFDGNEARSVVDSVTLKLYVGSATSGAFNTAAGTQTATYTYQYYDWTNFQTNSNDGFYTLTQATTNLYGTETYAYNQKAALVTANDSRGNHFQAQHQIPVLTDVIDAAGKTQFHWSYHADYYGAGWTALDTTYRPLGGEQVQSVWRGQSHGGSSSEGKNWVTYYDYSVNIKGSGQLSTGTISASGDVRNPLVTYTFSGFPCVTYKNIPVQKQIMDVRQNHVTDIYDMQGNHYHFEYDGLNRIIKYVEAMGTPLERTTSYTYTTFIENNDKPNDSLTPNTVTGPNLSVINNVNMFGQIERQTRTSPQGGSSTRITNYDYYLDSGQIGYGLLKVAYGERDGQQVGTVSTFPDKTEYTYDAWGNIATTKSFISNMHSGVTTTRLTQYFDYNSAGLPARKTDPDGKTTFYTYNAAFLVTNENYANLAGTSSTYNDLRQLTSSTDADGKTTNYIYDTLGRVISITKPAGNYISYEYYPNGVVKHERHYDQNNALSEETSQIIDGNGWLSSTWKTNATWLNISYGYDNNGNVTSQTDANGIVERWSYDAFNRVISHTNGNGKVDSKGYDSSDNVIRITDPNNNIAQHDYKNTNTLMHDINSELPIKRYWHDDSENNTKYQFGNRSCYYNDIDQIGRVRYSDCIDETNNDANLKAKTFYGWDDLNDRILNVVDETQGSFSDKGVNTYYEYDVLGRISKKRQMNKTPKQWGYPTTEQSVSYNYTTASRIQGITYPSGNRIEYGYSPAGRLDNIMLNNGHLLCAVDWDGADRLRGWAWGCQDQNRYSVYIGLPGIVENVINKINGQKQFSEVYTRDAAGRIVSKFMNDNHTKGYKYDNAGQLTSECHGQAANGTCYIGMTYTYDNNGNRLTKTFNTNNPAVALPANESYGYWRNVLTSWTIGGNAVALQTTAYQEVIDQRIGLPYYDFAGRRKLEGGVPGSTKYTSIWNEYNHKNERTFRGGSYLDRQYVYDESSHLIGEYKPDGSLIVEYIWMGDKPVAAIYPNNKVYWIVTDHQNTPRRLIDRDNQSTVWTWDSDAFGVSQPVGSVEMNLRFPGQYYDEQSKLYYNHNRYYNPELGRYMEPDPLALEAGLNMFAYADNNPVMNTDPSGLIIPALVVAAEFAVETSPIWGRYVARSVYLNAPYIAGFIEGLSPAAAGSIGASAAAGVTTKVEGGSYKAVKGIAGNEAHHMPADSISSLTKGEGPAISMTKADHRQTASWGRSKEAQSYRNEQKNLIEQGQFKQAQQKDIDDIQSKFGTKYDQQMYQMRLYTDHKGF
jgi:RHS repeat-associated protein